MTDEHQNPFASPIADDAVVETEVTAAGVPARRLTRLVAAFVDGIVLNLLMVPVMYFLAIGYFDPIVSNPELAAESTPFSVFNTPEQAVRTILGSLIGVGIYLLVNGYWLHHNGQTVGKKLFGIKIVRKDGSRATLGRLIGLRLLPMSLIALIPIVGNLVVGLVDPLLIFRKSRYCLHDDIADTAVVLDQP